VLQSKARPRPLRTLPREIINGMADYSILLVSYVITAVGSLPETYTM
jgi:hypothetical protein